MYAHSLPAFGVATRRSKGQTTTNWSFIVLMEASSSWLPGTGVGTLHLLTYMVCTYMHTYIHACIMYAHSLLAFRDHHHLRTNEASPKGIYICMHKACQDEGLGCTQPEWSSSSSSSPLKLAGCEHPHPSPSPLKLAERLRLLHREASSWWLPGNRCSVSVGMPLGAFRGEMNHQKTTENPCYIYWAANIKG